MARAYAAFANGGKRIDGSIFGNRPRVIVSVNGNEERAEARSQAISETNAEIVTSILQQVVQSGTGKRAQLPDGRPVAGKTGTTENYGDAWFVGYTPQLVAAVWVGYPNKLVPMLTQFHGDAGRRRHVPGADLAGVHGDGAAVPEGRPRELPVAEHPRRRRAPARPPRRHVPARQRPLQATRSRSRTSRGARRRRRRTASRTRSRCRTSSATTYDAARARLAAQPLTPVVVYKPASAGQPLHVVVKQFPPKGRLSSFDKVTIVFAKPLHGVIPDVVGHAASARRTAKLERLKLGPTVRGAGVTGRPPAARGRGSPRRRACRSRSGYAAADEPRARRARSARAARRRG